MGRRGNGPDTEQPRARDRPSPPRTGQDRFRPGGDHRIPRRAAIAAAALVAGLIFGGVVLGGTSDRKLVFATFTVIAIGISGSFCWLHLRRATPLALGMALSWIGAGSNAGWWFAYAATGKPEWMIANPLQFLFLAIYMAGAFLHGRVVSAKMGWPHYAWLLLPLLALVTTVTLLMLL